MGRGECGCLPAGVLFWGLVVLRDIGERISSKLWEQKRDCSGLRHGVGGEEVEGAFLGTTFSRSSWIIGTTFVLCFSQWHAHSRTSAQLCHWPSVCDMSRCANAGARQEQGGRVTAGKGSSNNQRKWFLQPEGNRSSYSVCSIQFQRKTSPRLENCPLLETGFGLNRIIKLGRN